MGAVRRVLGVLVVLVGAALVVAARARLPWYDVEPGRNTAGTVFRFDDLRANADGLDAAVSQAFFGYLAVVLLVVGAVAGVLANVPSPAANVLRLLAFTGGLAGVVATLYAVAQLFDAQRAAGGEAVNFTHNSSFGLWTCVAGFAFITVGGAGQTRSDSRSDTIGQ